MKWSLQCNSTFLLIEPVWNRNLPVPPSLTAVTVTFNRTSLESKRDCEVQLIAKSLFLLIEPVWNRNLSRHHVRLRKPRLLIEPVWNRNYCRYFRSCFWQHPFNRTSLESKLIIPCPYPKSCANLLIEPVWNRN